MTLTLSRSLGREEQTLDLAFLVGWIKVHKKGVVYDGQRGAIVALVLPEPEECPCCRHIYFCCNESGKAGCFTSEKAVGRGYVLCGWDEAETHWNYGKSIERFEDEILEVERIFWGAA